MEYHVRYNMVWNHEVTGRDADGDVVKKPASRADWMRIMWRQEPPPEPEIPEDMLRIWGVWWRLNGRRPASDGMQPIPFTEMESFVRLTNEILPPDEVMIIEKLDVVYMTEVSKQRKAMMEEERKKQESGKKRR